MNLFFFFPQRVPVKHPYEDCCNPHVRINKTVGSVVNEYYPRMPVNSGASTWTFSAADRLYLYNLVIDQIISKYSRFRGEKNEFKQRINVKGWNWSHKLQQQVCPYCVQHYSVLPKHLASVKKFSFIKFTFVHFNEFHLDNLFSII